MPRDTFLLVEGSVGGIRRLHCNLGINKLALKAIRTEERKYRNDRRRKFLLMEVIPPMSTARQIRTLMRILPPDLPQRIRHRFPRVSVSISIALLAVRKPVGQVLNPVLLSEMGAKGVGLEIISFSLSEAEETRKHFTARKVTKRCRKDRY